MNQIFFAKRNYPLHDDEFIHFQNLKNLTMDQFFFFAKKETIYPLPSQKQEFRKEERRKKGTKYFHFVA